MHNRLREFIKYKGVRLQVFAESVGWTAPYLSKLLRGENFGIQPLITLATAFPELNIRWLLTGDGSMLDTSKMAELQRSALDWSSSVLELERFVRFMNAEEIREFESSLRNGRVPFFPAARIEEWAVLAEEREALLEDKFSKALKKSKIKKS